MNSTLDYYNRSADKYIEDSLHADVSDLYAHFLPKVPKGGSILDLGCGSGRDSKHFMELGYHVTAVDGSEEFCRRASSLLGIEVKCKLFDEIDFISEFDGVWDCASLLHVPKNEIHGILQKIEKALKAEGIFYMSFKYGTEERIAGERTFSDYTEQDIPWLLSKTNMKCIEYWISEDVRADRIGEKWLNIITRKPR